ncbi:hypothetical protein [Microbacterium trichothecenolyticum]|nr:hypothetical protein [Microbacterium trichothecenolyticum]
MEDGRIVVSPADKLFPTPSAAVMNDGESAESWHTRNERLREKGYNGNGMGMPLTIAVQTLLPTPSAAIADGGQTSRSGARKGEPLLGGIAVEAATRSLLPTPNAALATSGPDYARGGRDAGGDDLATKIALLPTTTTAQDSEASGNGTGVTLPDVLQRERRGPVSDVDWGEYEPAIRQWEAVIGRPAPSPVRYDGRDGKPRLNPEFTEWMMGWPAGWLTDPVIGLTRAQALRAAGNGVVTLQARLAIRELLSREGVPRVRRAA